MIASIIWAVFLCISVLVEGELLLEHVTIEFQKNVHMMDNESPTFQPTFEPTVPPSAILFLTPTYNPTISPTTTPSKTPSFSPSAVPSLIPTFIPTAFPSAAPSTRTPTGPRIPTRRPTRAPSSRSPTATPAPTNTPVPTAVPTLRPTKPLPIIYANVEQSASLDDRVNVDNPNVISVFRQAIATSAGLTPERIQNLYFLKINATTTSASSHSSLRGSFTGLVYSLFHRSLSTSSSYSVFYTIYSVQTSSFVTTSSITTNIQNAIESGSFVTTLLSVASANSVNLYYASNVTSFTSTLVVTDLTPTNSPTRSPAEIFGSDFAGLDTQTQLIVGVTVGVVGLILFMACMAFLSLCLRRNCEELKQKRVTERRERRRQEQESVAKSVATGSESIEGSGEHQLEHTHDEETRILGQDTHTLGHRKSSGVEGSFFRTESGLPPPPPPHRQLSKHHSTRSKHSSGSDISSRESSPHRIHRKHLRGSPSRHRIESLHGSMHGSDYGSFAGLNDSYQRPSNSSTHGSDYGFTGLVDTFDNSSHAGRPPSGNASVVSGASDPATVALAWPSVNSQQAQMFVLQQQLQQQQQQQAMQRQQAMQQQQQMQISAMQQQALQQQALQQHVAQQQAMQQQAMQQQAMQQQAMQQQAMQQQAMLAHQQRMSMGIAGEVPLAPYLTSQPAAQPGYPPRPPNTM